MKKFNLRGIVFLALLTALSIVIGRLLLINLTNSLRISFGNIPIILASLWFGPVAGMAVGFVSDFVGTNLFSSFPWYPPLAVTPVFFGLFPSLMKPLLLKQISFWRLLVVIMSTNVFGTMLWSTYALSNMTGTPFLSLIVYRVPLYICIATLETICIYYLQKSGLERFLFKDKSEWYKN